LQHDKTSVNACNLWQSFSPLKFTFSYALKSSRHDSTFIFFPLSESPLYFFEALSPRVFELSLCIHVSPRAAIFENV